MAMPWGCAAGVCVCDIRTALISGNTVLMNGFKHKEKTDFGIRLQTKFMIGMIQLFDGELAAYEGVPHHKEHLLSTRHDTPSPLGGGVSVRPVPRPHEREHRADPKGAPDPGRCRARHELPGIRFFSARITRPIKNLMKHVEGISKDDYEPEIRAETRGEIGYLHLNFTKRIG